MYYPYYFDWTMMIVLPGILLMSIAQIRVSTTFNKYNKVISSANESAATVCRKLLNEVGLAGVKIERVSGTLSDHYDPSSRILRLSDATYHSASVGAIGVAAHEAGHALQHVEGYTFFNVRQTIFPVVNICSNLAIPMLFLGFLLELSGLITVALVLYASVLVFQLVTLPVEFNASRRATAMLQSSGYLTVGEVAQAKKVLNAAAWTYIASTLLSMLQLLRLVAIASNRKKD